MVKALETFPKSNKHCDCLHRLWSRNCLHKLYNNEATKKWMDTNKNIVKFHLTPSVEIWMMMKMRVIAKPQQFEIPIPWIPIGVFSFQRVGCNDDHYRIGGTPGSVFPLFIVHTCFSLHSVVLQNITLLCVLDCVIFVVSSLSSEFQDSVSVCYACSVSRTCFAIVLYFASSFGMKMMDTLAQTLKI